MRVNSSKEHGRFELGPFTVTFRPLHGIYTRYALEIDGVEIRAQISYPEEADGWVGYACAVRDKVLSLDAQHAFRARCEQLQKQIKPVVLGGVILPREYGRGYRKPKP